MNDTKPQTFGVVDGETCWRNGCQGVIAIRPSENCCCHISAPCGSCTSARMYCPECQWEESEAEWGFNGHVIKYADSARSIVKSIEPRPLDPRKIDYRIIPYCNSAQICEGVCPQETTKEEVLKLVKGTFGGRFESFGNGKFKYIAYTD